MKIVHQANICGTITGVGIYGKEGNPFLLPSSTQQTILVQLINIIDAARRCSNNDYRLAVAIFLQLMVDAVMID